MAKTIMTELKIIKNIIQLYVSLDCKMVPSLMAPSLIVMTGDDLDVL